MSSLPETVSADRAGTRTPVPGGTAPGDEPGSPPASDRSVGSFSNGEIFEVLSNRRRRYALHYLLGHADESVRMGDLARQVAAWESGVAPEALSYADRKTVHTSLYQFHVPKLDAYGVVDYDSERGAVELTPAGQRLDLYLEAVQGDDIPWAEYFVLLSAFSAVLVAATWLDAVPFASLPDIAAGGFAVAAFLVSSLVFAYETHSSMRFGAGGPPPEVRQG